MDHVDILGVKIDKSSYREVLDRIEKQIKSKKQAWIATPNPEIVLKAGESEKYRQVLNSANLRISDGIGLSVATKYLDKIKDRNYKLETLGKLWLWKITVLEMLWDKKLVEKILPQISGDELIFKLLPLARKNNWKIFLLGGKQGNAKLASEKINNKYGVEVKSHPGAVCIEKELENENKEIINAINKFKPDILLVAYGAPYQEIWISKNFKKLKTYIAIGIGGTIDDIANDSQTPLWLRKRGLRWLWRLVKEPRRMGRIWNAVVIFGWKMIRS